MAACQLFFWIGCGWSQRAALRRKKAELLRQTHTHSPNFSKATDGGFIKKTGGKASALPFFYSGAKRLTRKPFAAKPLARGKAPNGFSSCFKQKNKQISSSGASTSKLPVFLGQAKLTLRISFRKRFVSRTLPHHSR